jgi:hypothetical protein
MIRVVPMALLSQRVVAMTAWGYGSLLSQGRRNLKHTFTVAPTRARW